MRRDASVSDGSVSVPWGPAFLRAPAPPPGPRPQRVSGSPTRRAGTRAACGLPGAGRTSG
eukprot:352001-Chlamydomonas_euryale.AAC.1